MTTKTGNGSLSSDLFDNAIALFDRREASEVSFSSGTAPTVSPIRLMDAVFDTATANADTGDDSTALAATASAAASRSYWTLLLLVFPVVTAFGNVLVCLSVYSERSLRTVTNYYIVSLAVADIMVAVLVMPLAVYVEVSYHGHASRFSLYFLSFGSADCRRHLFF